jgi:thiamine-monophosphate kinase
MLTHGQPSGKPYLWPERGTRQRILGLVTPTAKPRAELALIAGIRQRAAATGSRHLRLGIGDDCAILAPPRGHELLVTTDFSLEGRHFRRSSGGAWHSPASIGHRTLARGLSDLAAMGAQPLATFLSLALPRSVARKPAWLDGFLDGLLALAAAHNLPLAGGDTSESPSDHILADIVLIGYAPKGRALRRSGARPGDTIYVTGALGGAAAELSSLSGKTKRAQTSTCPLLTTHYSLFTASPHLFPQPRIAVGRALLRRKLATACIDLSDGISTDLAHLCEESRLAARIDAAALPLHPLTRSLAPSAALHAALHGGEDYELLFTADPATRVPKSIAGVPITPIGTMLSPRRSRPRVTLVQANAHTSELLPQGWEHLR